MLLSKKSVIASVCKALKIKKINMNSGSENIDSWDSLAQLTILSELDKKTNGKIFNIHDISRATSVKDIIKVLKKAKLYK